jgi:hypothetical protein
MGTSQSSRGSPSGVPMVPPWVPAPAAPPDQPADGGETDLPDVAGPDDQPTPGAPNSPIAPSRLSQVPIAPEGRFRGTRLSLGKFAGSGDTADMRRGLGRYVKTGYGGVRTATRRFEGTASTAGALHGALSPPVAGQPPAPGSPLDPALLAGRSAREVMDAIVEAVRPPDGTLDAEASRAAIKDALSELLTRYEEADLLALTPEQREFAIERFVAIDVYRRFALDVGKTIQDKAPSAATGLSRLKQVKDYIKERIAASFRKLRDAGRTISSGRVNEIVRAALADTLQVFEGYAE